MYEITVTDEFARWFEGLTERQAEHVASALEVVAASGPVVDASRCSPWLLWFDGVPADGDLLPWLRREPPPGAHAHTELARWQREVVRCLESPLFQSALHRLPPREAAQVLEAVRQLRAQQRAAWLSLANVGAASGTGAAQAFEATAFLKSALEATLGLVGLELSQLGDAGGSLRELTVAELTPKLRVIYGLDPSAQRLVALVGDVLARQYYGDSVRLAERRWREYYQRGSGEARWPRRPRA